MFFYVEPYLYDFQIHVFYWKNVYKIKRWKRPKP